MKDENPELPKLLFQTFLTIIGVLATAFLLAYFARNQLIEFSEHFVRIFSYPGLFFGMVLSDSLPAFVPPDAFLMLSIAGNMDAFWTILSLSLGSLLGGSIAFAIGKWWIPHYPPFRRILRAHEHQLLPYIKQYGVGGVILAALTPIPYSWMAYFVGVFHMPYLIFLLGSLFRIPRFLLYYYAISLGWM